MPNTSLTNSRIEETFHELRRRREGGLIAYLTGGDPNTKSFLANSASLVEGGADIVEIGIPFSDPIADGPVIQTSSNRALSNGATPTKILDAIGELTSEYQVPFVILSYYNPLLAMGAERFLKKARDCGVSGIVVPDLPLEEGSEFGNISAKNGIDNILLVAPNTSPTRLRSIVATTNGFVYLVSLYGVTGPRDKLSPQALETVRTVKSIAKDKVPIAAGFGIASPENVSSLLSAGADGAIVGSALVKIVTKYEEDPSNASNALRSMVRSLKQATIAPSTGR